MFKIIIITVLSTLLYACTNNSHTLEGQWFSPKPTKVIEFKNGKVIAHRIGSEEVLELAEYEQLTDSTYILKGEKINKRVLTITADWKDNSFSLTEMSEYKDKVTGPFTPVPKAKLSDITGTWYEHTIDQEYETSIIITQRELSYDYDSLEINHNNKTYSRMFTPNIPFTFKDGFIFNEIDPETGDTFSYYLTSYNEKEVSFIGQYGNFWTQTRSKNPSHIAIPKGYTEKK